MRWSFRSFLDGLAAAIAALMMSLILPAPAFAQVPKAKFSAARLAFGSVVIGQTPSMSFLISNTGNASLTAGIANFQPPFLPGSSTSFSIAPRRSHRVFVRFAPALAGPAGDTLTVTTNDPRHASVSVKLSGSARPGTQIKITSVSNAAPLPLTPLTISTAALKPKLPVTVEFVGASGFNVADKPMRVGSDGSVVVAVPLYFDPSSNGVGEGTVSLVLLQKRKISAPISLDIQNLPPLSNYGQPLGQISHDFLVYNTLLLGRRMAELQAAQILLGIDTSEAQFTLSTLLTATIEARNDVDRVLIDNTTVISNGTLSDGTPIQFDQNSQDMMDRVFALYLLQQFRGAVGPRTAGTSYRAASDATDLKAILNLLNGHATVTGLIKDLQDAQNPGDAGYAMVKGAAGYFDAVRGNELAGQLGSGFAILDIGRAAIDAAYDLGSLYVDSNNGGDPAAIAQDLANLNKDDVKLFDASLSTLSFGFLSGVQAGTQGSITIQGLGLALTDEQILGSLAGLNMDEASMNVGNTLKPMIPFPSPNDGFGEIDGMANISNSQGVAAAQSSIDLCCFGTSALGITGIADPSGDYDMFVPLGVSGTDYTNLTLTAGDFVSGSFLSSEAVDLSGLNTNQPIQPPSLTGSCSDSDVLSPDADDPDCD